jgi:hypothetical protein
VISPSAIIFFTSASRPDDRIVVFVRYPAVSSWIIQWVAKKPESTGNQYNFRRLSYHCCIGNEISSLWVENNISGFRVKLQLISVSRRCFLKVENLVLRSYGRFNIHFPKSYAGSRTREYSHSKALLRQTYYKSSNSKWQMTLSLICSKGWFEDSRRSGSSPKVTVTQRVSWTIIWLLRVFFYLEGDEGMKCECLFFEHYTLQR